MKKLIPLILIISLFGCKATVTPDYAALVSGKYYITTINSNGGGNVAISNPSDYITLTKTGTGLITLYENLTSGQATITNVKVSDGGSSNIKLTYSDASGQLNGYEQNNILTYTIVTPTSTVTVNAKK